MTSKNPEDPTRLLKAAFVGCCLLSALAGLMVGISCELRRRPECLPAWRDGAAMALAAGGVLAAALARFTGNDQEGSGG